MLLGHIPAGYIVGKLNARWLKRSRIESHRIILAGMFGALTPDMDMVYFHLVDNRQHHHHTYWSHYPTVWLTLLLVSFTYFRIAPKQFASIIACTYATAGVVHLLLDSIVGDIWWFAPFRDKSYALFTVPALFQPWWLNFILHWTFVFEIIVVVWSIMLWKSKA